jgi:hypothetical protein
VLEKSRLTDDGFITDGSFKSLTAEHTSTTWANPDEDFEGGVAFVMRKQVSLSLIVGSRFTMEFRAVNDDSTIPKVRVSVLERGRICQTFPCREHTLAH